MLTRFPPAHGSCPVRQMNCKWLWQIWFSPGDFLSDAEEILLTSWSKLSGEGNVSTVQLQRRYHLRHGTTGFFCLTLSWLERWFVVKCGTCVTRLFHALHIVRRCWLVMAGLVSAPILPHLFAWCGEQWNWENTLCFGARSDNLWWVSSYLFDWAVFCRSACKGLAWMELCTSHF